MGGTAWGLSSLVKVTKIIPVITSQFKNLASVIGMISNPAVISSIGGIGTALSTVGGFAGVALPMLLGISAALVGIVELVDYIENKDVRKLENLSSAIQDTNDKIAEMSGAGSEYETLINNADKLTEKEQARLGVLQAQLDNLKEQAAEQEAAYLKEWQDQQTKQRTETVHELVTGSATEVPEGATKLYGQYWDVATTTEYTDSQRAAENLRTAINKLNSEKRQGVTVGNEYISKLQGIIDEYQETYDTTIKVRDAGYELDDSQEYLIKVMEHQKEVIAGLGEEYAKNSEDISQFANALDESVSKLDTYIDALDQYRGANEDAATAGDILVQSLFDTNGELTEAAKQALTTDSAMASMAQSFIEAQQAQAKADFSALILAIQEVGNAAMITSSQIANMMAMAGVNIGGASSGTASANLQRTYKDITGKTAASDEAAYKSWMQSYLYEKGQASYQRKMEEYQKQLSQISVYAGGGGGGGGSSRKSAEEKAAEEAEKQAKKAQQAQEKAAKQSQQAYESAAKSAEQAAQEAARAAEQAAEEAKQKILDSIQELKDASDDFWDSKTDAIEETNKELDRQKQLEEKLKALEEAKQKKILLYKNGQFQYDKDYGTIAKAQADYEETRDKIQRERELEQLEEMKDNATEIFNEMKDIVQNGGDVTQEMINNWLSQMQADGADYYDSNKKLLGEWLEWARGAITEFGLSISQAMNTLSASGGSSSSGTFGETPKLWGLNYWGEDESKRENSSPYVDFWHDMFKYELLGGDPKIAAMYGSVYVDYTKKILDGLDDVYEEQDYLQRNQAIKKLYDEMKKLTDQLGYVPDYLKDFMEIGAGLKSNIDIIAMQYAKNYDKLGSVGKTTLDAILSGNEDYMVANKSRIADIAGGTAEDLMHWSYRRLAGSSAATKQLWDKRTENDKKVAESIYGDKLSQLQTMIDRAGGIVTDEIYKWATKNIAVLNPDGTGLTSMYPDVTAGDKYLYQSQAALEQLGYHGFLGNFGHTSEGGVSSSTAALIKNIILGSTVSNTREERRNRLIAGNISSIEDHLEDVAHGQAISQGYITRASDYISKMIAENSEKWFTLYDQTEKDKLHQQTEELRTLQEKLQKANDLAEINNLLVHGEGLLPNEKADFKDEDWKDDKKYEDWVREAEDLDDTAEDIRRQMELNANRWFDADEKTRDELHRANEELAERLAQETGTNLSYSGSTGKWSKNATGTHNFKGGLSLVGENGPELRVLTRGDNVIPANQTANLWKWSNTTPQQMLTTLSARSGGGNTSYAFNVSRIELPNVTDAKSFVQGLKNYALQYSYKR